MSGCGCTQGSNRWEKGVDPHLAEPAANLATSLSARWSSEPNAFRSAVPTPSPPPRHMMNTVLPGSTARITLRISACHWSIVSVADVESPSPPGCGSLKTSYPTTLGSSAYRAAIIAAKAAYASSDRAASLVQNAFLASDSPRFVSGKRPSA